VYPVAQKMTTYVPEDMIEVRLCLGRSSDLSRIADSIPVTLNPGVQLPAVGLSAICGTCRHGLEDTGS
jgi:hypothetical protein